jgi:hypothetical protein
MEFLLVLVPIVGISTLVVLSLFLVVLTSWIFKFEHGLPVGKILLVTVILAVVASGYKLVTSPLTRPTVNQPLNDLQKYQVDSFNEIEMPVLVDKSFKTETVDVTTFIHDEKINKHADSKH